MTDAGGGGPLLEARGLTKRFPGVVALAGVDFSCRAGEVHALVGENGAGKSTLIKLLTGVHEPDAGEIVVGGERLERVTPEDARRLGIAVIHQEFTLLPELSVAENILLGREPRTRLGLVDVRAVRARARELLERLHVDLDVRAPVATLSVAQQQLAEIAKALAVDARFLIMDEPSAVIAGEELEQLFAVVESLRRRGVGVVYISHRLDEVFRLSDRVTVLKDGALVGTRATADTTRDELVRMMVGRTLAEEYAPPVAEPGEPVLSVSDLAAGGFLRGISFELRAGEILGVAGLVGAGRTMLARTLYGLVRAERGEIVVAGRRGQPRSPGDAVRRGLVLVPEDRKGQGVLLDQSVRFNLSLPAIGRLTRGGLVRRAAERRLAAQVVADLAIRPPDPERTVALLSGGNQQKVVLGKWLGFRPRVVVVDEPTRGVDVGGKVEIYARLRELTAQGVGVLMISSELPEVIGMSDRVLVLHEGRQAGILERDRLSEEAIVRLATGHRDTEDPMSSVALAVRRARVGNRLAVAYAAVYALLLVLVVYGAVSEPSFRTWDNAVNVLNQSIILGLVAIGQTLVVLSGGIDFSVGAVVKLTVVVGAIVMNGHDGMIAPAILACLGVGLAVGLANGLVATQLAANPFIVTFGMASVLRGIVFTISTAPIGLASTGYLKMYDASIGSLPYAVLVMAAFWALAWVVAARTPFGRSLYAVGGNDVVARLAGMRPDRVRVAVYAASGALAAVAGIYALARSGIGDPTAGDNLEFDAITAVALGGTSLYGGVGGIAGTLGGVLLLTLVSNVFNLLQISSWYQGMLKGAIILAAVAIYVRRRR